MILNNKLFLNTNNRIVVYCENNNLLCGSVLGYWKVKFDTTIYFNCNDLYTKIYVYIINNIIGNNYNRIIMQLKNNNSLFKYIIRCIYFGNSSRFRIIGRGYKLYSQMNHLLLKLGYSHIINYTLPIYYEIHKKDKHNNFYKITGLSKEGLNNIIFILKSFRIPNVYSKKGVFIKNELVIFKEGKKNFTL